MFCETIDYSRQIIKENLEKYKWQISEYSNFSFETFEKWINKLKAKFNTDLIKIDCYTSTEYDDSSCTGREFTMLNFVPYIEREENDKEYTQRIRKEEQEYENLKRIQELRNKDTLQYQKDLEEYNRIKEKYHL